MNSNINNFDKKNNKKKIFLDYNATTPIDPDVLKAMLPFFKEKYHNPSSMYTAALEIQEEVNKARDSIAKYLGAFKEEIIFTSSSTEATNFAIIGALKANPNKNHVITSQVEHSSVYETVKELNRDNYKTTFIPVDKNGNLNEEAFLNSINENTAIISIMHANNETGVIFPVEKLARLAKEKNKDVLFHTDATQTTGKLDINLNSNEFKNVDLLSTSGHKIYAPKGIGLLYIRKGVKLRKFICGGHHEFNKRAGTLNVPFIIGFAKAFELAKKDKAHNKNLKLLRNKMEEELKKTIPYMYINGENANRLSNTSNIAFDCVEGESILYLLDEHGFLVSSGSACTSGSMEPSHVLKAMNVPPTALHSSLRISFGRYTKEKDIYSFTKKLPLIINKLREISPFWDKTNNKPDFKNINDNSFDNLSC
jgi:cysteine desulfurase